MKNTGEYNRRCLCGIKVVILTCGPKVDRSNLISISDIPSSSITSAVVNRLISMVEGGLSIPLNTRMDARKLSSTGGMLGGMLGGVGSTTVGRIGSRSTLSCIDVPLCVCFADKKKLPEHCSRLVILQRHHCFDLFPRFRFVAETPSQRLDLCFV